MAGTLFGRNAVHPMHKPAAQHSGLGRRSRQGALIEVSGEQALSEPVLLAGGNPQIPKGDGDAPVQSYIAAMPGWKSDIGRRLDDLIVRVVADVRKAVRWNSPFYGVEGRGWFASCHVLTRCVRVTFLNGASLRPVPPGSGKDRQARWIDVGEDGFATEQMEAWIRQSSAIDGWHGFG